MSGFQALNLVDNVLSSLLSNNKPIIPALLPLSLR